MSDAHKNVCLLIRCAVMHQARLEMWALPVANTRQGQGVSYAVNVVNWGYGEACEGEGKCFSYSRVAH